MKTIVLLLMWIPAWPQAVRADYAKLPLSFEPNLGQTDARVKFLARAPGYMLYLTSDEVVIAGRDGSVERMNLIGANRKARFEPLDKQQGIGALGRRQLGIQCLARRWPLR